MNKIKSLIAELINITECAALECFKWSGMGKKDEADDAAVKIMRKMLNEVDFDAKIAIGEGERDNAPMLFIGERVGLQRPNSLNNNDKSAQFDIAVDPLEGTNLCANFQSGSIAVLAITQAGGFLHAPDVYMEKIAVSAAVEEGVVSLKNSTIANLNNIIDSTGCSPDEILVTVLDRPRHRQLISDIHKVGARVKLISDGDVNAVIATAIGDPNYLNVYMGTGGAPEGVLAAAALRTLGGYMEGRLMFNETQKIRAKESMNILDFNKIYTAQQMASKDCAFIATGVTTGEFLNGVSVNLGHAAVNSMVLTSWDKGVQYMERSFDCGGF